MKPNFKSLTQYAEYLHRWVKQYLKKVNKAGIVIGVSGGIDSALALAICLLKKDIKVYPYFIDIENSKLDIQCIKALEKQYQIKIPTLNLKTQYLSLVKQLKITDKLSKSNLKPRLRMLTLYGLSQQNNALVLGTSNLDELYLGYYTKYGDGACDLALLSKLIKSEIFMMAKELGLPKMIINRAPSASLFAGQTDEQEMGLKYKDIDAYLSKQKISVKIKQLIEQKHLIAQHKKTKLIEPPKAFITRKII